MLQAYALKTCLEHLGHKVYFIDYKNPILVKRYTFFQLSLYKSVKSKIRVFFTTICHLKRRFQTKYKFKKFENSNFRTIPLCLLKQIGMIIVGSDQVWNPIITEGYDPFYYGKLAELGIPHISYAASCPSKFISENLKVYLNRFKSIGYRDESMRIKLCGLGYKPYHTLDPTLLLNQSDYIELIDNNRNINEKYIYIYNLNAGNKPFEIAKEMKKNHNDISKIVGNLNNRNHDVDIVTHGAGPCDFLNLINNAEYTVVSSFHGTAFSIIFHKKFIYYPFNSEKDERAFSLLYSLGLSQCIWNKDFDFDMIENINWIEVEKKLLLQKSESINYLNTQIKNVYS